MKWFVLEVALEALAAASVGSFVYMVLTWADIFGQVPT